MKYFIALAGIVLVCFSNLSIAKPLPIEAFTKSAQYEDLKLSPNGVYFAASIPTPDRKVLAVFNRKTLKPTHVFRFDADNHISSFFWVNDERIVFTRNYQERSQEYPVTNGQIYAANFDGSDYEILFGFSAGAGKMGSSSRIKRSKKPQRAFGRILNLLPDDPEHILIESQKMDNKDDSSREVIKLNVYSGKQKKVTRTPFGNFRIVFNRQGEPVIGLGTDPKGNERTFLYEDRGWSEVPTTEPLYDYNPISTNTAGDKLYLITHVDSGTESLFEYDFKSKKIEKIFNHPTSDIQALIKEPATNIVVGAEVMPDSFEYHYFEAENEFAKIHRALAIAFHGKDITITSRTKDLGEMIVLVKSDKNPGDFYLFNRKDNSVKYLVSRKQWLDPAKLSERKPIQFKARDGATIYGYLTMPINVKEKVPLIVNVHGGPYGKQDTWFFDTESQLFANFGYAVLQVNYRGSGGYGLKYENVAYQKRHTLIQEDIIDGTRWALAQPEINANACIYGWSFGGYSALMAPLKEPDLFKCSVAAAGVYDAVLQEEEADYSRIGSISARAAKVYGSEEAVLKAESPITYIDKLKTPILIAHGGKDKRVPPEQAHLLREALDDRKMPYEWLFKEKEGHGFYNEENRKEFYEKSLDFFEKYLK